MGIVGTVLLIAACAGGALAFLFGFFRRVSRVAWTGLQILLLFCYTLIVGAAPVPANGGTYFWLVVVFFGVALALVLGAEALIRRSLLNRSPAGKGKMLGRFAGGFACALNVLVLIGVLGGLVLGIVDALPTTPAAFQGVLGSAFWQKFFAHSFLDLFFVALCFLFVRAGLRLGVLKGIYYLLMFAMTFGGLLGAYLLATKVKAFAGWGAGIAAKFGSLSPAAASALGHGIITLIFFVIIFAVVMIIGALLHWGIRKLLNCSPVGIVSSVLLGILFYAVFIAFACAFNYGAAYLVHELSHQFEFIGEMAYAASLESILTSSPLSSVFYLHNPFAALLGI